MAGQSRHNNVMHAKPGLRACFEAIFHRPGSVITAVIRLSMNSLEASIDNLYSAFARIPKPQEIDGCECCVDERDLERLLSFNVRAEE